MKSVQKVTVTTARAMRVWPHAAFAARWGSAPSPLNITGKPAMVARPYGRFLLSRSCFSRSFFSLHIRCYGDMMFYEVLAGLKRDTIKIKYQGTIQEVQYRPKISWEICINYHIKYDIINKIYID